MRRPTFSHAYSLRNRMQILLLNKNDLFEKTLKRVPVKEYFPVRISYTAVSYRLAHNRRRTTMESLEMRVMGENTSCNVFAPSHRDEIRISSA